MCTLFFYNRCLGAGTLALAANRDEDPGRPFGPPRMESVSGKAVLLPRDHRGGTWIGTDGRLLASLTNMPRSGGPPGGRSRGLLVRGALGRAGARDARLWVEDRLGETSYDGFNLLLADPDLAVVLTWNGRDLCATEMAVGPHLLRHRVPGPRPDPQGVPRPDAGHEPEAFLRGPCAEALCRHADVPDSARTCRHGERFATVCSSLVFLDPRRPARSLFLFAPGPPCRTSYRECSAPLPEARPDLIGGSGCASGSSGGSSTRPGRAGRRPTRP